MSTYAYERLSGQDRSFLVFEGPNTHMHLGGTTVFEAGPLTTTSGGIDIGRIRAYIGSRLHWIPRYRQRLAFIPVQNYPVWVDDDRFNLDYHVRHTSLPRPGDLEQLKRLSGRIMSQPLDRRRPLWEAWIVEGLQDDRFALIIKTHHCVVDGISGVDLMSVLLSPTAERTVEDTPRWAPRPAPSPFELLRDDLMHRVGTPLEVTRRLRDVVSDPGRAGAQLMQSLTGAWEVVSAGLQRPADTPLNQPIGPFRRFEWHRLSLADVKAVKNRLGGTVNDVILATVSGALRRFLTRRTPDLAALDYKAVVPVSMRADAELGGMGNRVSAWMFTLPLNERDPLVRYAKVSAATARLKQSQQARGIEILTQVAELVDPILTLGVRLAARMHPYNLIVTNVPGPQAPLYLLGTRMLEGYPTVPLFEYQGLGVATFSYDGSLFWGLNADWDLVPDLGDLRTALAASFAELYELAHREVAPRPARPRARRRTGVVAVSATEPRRTRSRGI